MLKSKNKRLKDDSNSFCFCTVASKNYIAHAAGLFANLREIYPHCKFIIGAIDDETHFFFNDSNFSNLLSVTSNILWGEEYWENMKCRMNTPELAYATKSALAHWCLVNDFNATLLLDADVVVLSEINDLINDCKTYDLVLVPTHHKLPSWKRTQRAGIFSAGVIGCSNGALQSIKAWMMMCFEECTILPIAGLYNEQKYLELLVGHQNTKIVIDHGINLSATTFSRFKPELKADGLWYTKDGDMVRIFHVSRTTCSDFPLSKTKEVYNNNGTVLLGKDKYVEIKSTPPSNDVSTEGSFWTLGKIFEYFQKKITYLCLFIQVITRIYQSRKKFNYTKCKKVLNQKEKLLENFNGGK